MLFALAIVMACSGERDWCLEEWSRVSQDVDRMPDCSAFGAGNGLSGAGDAQLDVGTLGIHLNRCA